MGNGLIKTVPLPSKGLENKGEHSGAPWIDTDKVKAKELELQKEKEKENENEKKKEDTRKSMLVSNFKLPSALNSSSLSSSAASLSIPSVSVSASSSSATFLASPRSSVKT